MLKPKKRNRMVQLQRDPPLLLIADDDPELTGILIKRLQQSEGYEFITAADGVKALEMIREQKPDAVILDVMMPRKNGWEVLREIRRDEFVKDTSVLMLTGIGASLNEMTSPLHGADAYLDKPFNFSELTFKIKKMLNAKR